MRGHKTARERWTDSTGATWEVTRHPGVWKRTSRDGTVSYAAATRQNGRQVKKTHRTYKDACAWLDATRDQVRSNTYVKPTDNRTRAGHGAHRG